MPQYVPPTVDQVASMNDALNKCANALTQSQTFLLSHVGAGSQLLAFVTGNSDNLDALQANWNQYNTWYIQAKETDFNDVLAGNTSMEYFFDKCQGVLDGCAQLQGVTNEFTVTGITSEIAQDVKTSVKSTAEGLKDAATGAVNNAAFGIGFGLVAVAVVYLLYVYAVSRVASA